MRVRCFVPNFRRSWGSARACYAGASMRLRLASLLSAVVAAAAAAVPDSEAAALAEENSMLQLKLKRLEDELQQELKYSYVIACVDTYAVPQPCRTYRVRVSASCGYRTFLRHRAACPGRTSLPRAYRTYRVPWHHRSW